MEGDLAVELDYAFLASWAGIQADGTLTAAGMSFLRRKQSDHSPIAIAGRIRMRSDLESAYLTIRLSPPTGGGAVLEISDRLTPSGGDAGIYDANRRQILFVLNTQLMSAALGTYDVELRLNGDMARNLSFEVVAETK